MWGEQALLLRPALSDASHLCSYVLPACSIFESTIHQGQVSVHATV